MAVGRALDEAHHAPGLVYFALKGPLDRFVEGCHALVGTFGDKAVLTLGPFAPRLRVFAARVPLDQVVHVLRLAVARDWLRHRGRHRG